MPKKLTTEEFIKRAREVHGDKYDYSKVEYKKANEKVEIICPIHGSFFQSPSKHLSGSGCPYCAGNVKLTTEEFVRRAKKIHNNEYDYSEVVYINSKTKIKIKCKKCNRWFKQLPLVHLNGSGCPFCFGDKIKRKFKKSTDDFIKEARKVHGDKYDYSLVDYKNNKTKVKIICPIHGIFEQRPLNHLKGCGCPKCANEERNNNKKLNNDIFIDRAKKIHGDRYDYSLVEYKDIDTKVKIICPIHGVFEQSSYNHLHGYGCPECAKMFAGFKRRKGKEWFIKKAKQVHGDKYDYSKVVYNGIHKKVEIICPIHGSFWQRPDHHLRGHGCVYCKKVGWFDFNKPAILYYIKVYHNGNIYYKIGITNRTIEERFSVVDRMKIEVIKIWKFDKGIDAHKKEQEILRKYKKFRYRGSEKILVSEGNTELFVRDVLNLDNKEVYNE